MTKADNQAVRVLYMHGLESGPRGRKVQALKSLFNVCSPNMHVSVSFHKSNGIARHIMLSWPFMTACALLVAWSFALLQLFPERAWLLILLSCLFVGMSTWRFFVRRGLRKAVNNSIEIQRQAIEAFKPDVVVGSSWGGGMALLCSHMHIWRGPVVALAPAITPFIKYRALDNITSIDDLTRTITNALVVVHGSNDTTIAPIDSERLISSLAHRRGISQTPIFETTGEPRPYTDECARGGCALHVVVDGHRLSGIKKAQFGQYVAGVVRMHSARDEACRP